MKIKNLFVSLSVVVMSILSLLVLVPFNSEAIKAYEWVIKVVLFGIASLGLSLFIIIGTEKGKNNENVAFIGQNVVISIYIQSMLLSLAQYEIKFDVEAWMPMFTVYCILSIIFILVSFVFILGKGEAKKIKHNKSITIVLYLLLLVTMIHSLFKINMLNGNINPEINIKDLNLASFVIGLILSIGYIISYFLVTKSIEDKKEIIFDKEKYLLYKKDYLLNMHDFSEVELEKLGYTFAKDKEMKVLEVEKPVEVEKVVEKIVEVEKIIEVEKPVEVEKIVEVEKVVEKIVEVEKPVIVYMEKPKTPKKPKEKKVIEPTVAQIAEYIQNNFEDANIIYGKNEDNYKVYRNKKLMCIVQSSANDYKIIFQRKPISVAKLLIKYPNVIVKANSPQGEQWFKVVNKGDVSEDDLKAIIKFSHKYLVDEEAKEIAKKEKAKAKLLAKKAAEKEKIKAKKEAIRAKEKAKKQAEKAKLKAKEEAAKAKEKEKIKAQKAREEAKAKEKAERERQKQAEKEARLTEQAVAKEHD